MISYYSASDVVATESDTLPAQPGQVFCICSDAITCLRDI